MQTAIQAARNAGRRIVFVSDTCLPECFIRRLLLKHNLAIEGDGFYISSRRRKTKITGSLFREMLTAEGVYPSAVEHTGDNLRSDVVQAAALGIHTRAATEVELTDAEKQIRGCRALDSLTAARIAGAMRASRLDLSAIETHSVRNVVSQFVGPFQLAFVSWVLAQARAQGVKRLYFVSRDGQLAYKIAQSLAPQYGDVDCRYLLMSRQAVLLPSATDVTPKAMPWLHRSFETPKLSELLAKLELQYADVESRWQSRAGEQRGEYILKNASDWTHFWKVLQDEPLRASLLTRIQQRRQAAIAYFRNSGLMDPVPMAIVDFGWWLLCQNALNQLLRTAGRVEPIHGFYLGTSPQRLGRSEVSGVTALFQATPGDLSEISPSVATSENPTLFEHILGIADHATVDHYEGLDECATPVLQSNRPTTEQQRFCTAMHAGAISFAQTNQHLSTELSTYRTARALTAELVAAVLESAPLNVVREIAGLPITSNQNGLNYRPLISPLSVWEVLHRILPWRLAKFVPAPTHKHYWMAGDWRATKPLYRRLIQTRQLLGRAYRSVVANT
jgi:hypothetical protein